jgi:hypothetical protein
MGCLPAAILPDGSSGSHLPYNAWRANLTGGDTTLIWIASGLPTKRRPTPRSAGLRWDGIGHHDREAGGARPRSGLVGGCAKVAQPGVGPTLAEGDGFTWGE